MSCRTPCVVAASIFGSTTLISTKNSPLFVRVSTGSMRSWPRRHRRQQWKVWQCTNRLHWHRQRGVPGYGSRGCPCGGFAGRRICWRCCGRGGRRQGVARRFLHGRRLSATIGSRVCSPRRARGGGQRVENQVICTAGAEQDLPSSRDPTSDSPPLGPSAHPAGFDRSQAPIPPGSPRVPASLMDPVSNRLPPDSRCAGALQERSLPNRHRPW